MLQGRLFSYQDAQRYRLGVNHHQIPVNAPKCPYHTTHRDGAMRVDNNGGKHPNYAPNRFDTYVPTHDQLSLQLEREAAHLISVNMMKITTANQRRCIIFSIRTKNLAWQATLLQV